MTKIENPELFNFKDPKTGSKIDLPVEIETETGKINLKELIFATIEKSSSELNKTKTETERRFSELQETINQSNMTVEQMKAKIQEYEDSKLPEHEKQIKEWQRKLEIEKSEREKAIAKAAEWESNFKKTKIENDIYSELSKHDFNNYDHAMQLLRSQTKTDLVDNNGKFETRIEMFVGGHNKSLSPKEAVELFKAIPEHSYLLKNNLKSGGGTKLNGTAPAEKNEMKRSDFMALPNSEKIRLSKQKINIID